MLQILGNNLEFLTFLNAAHFPHKFNLTTACERDSFETSLERCEFGT